MKKKVLTLWRVLLCLNCVAMKRIYFLIFLFFVGCQIKTTKEVKSQLIVQKTLEEFSDSTFFSDIRGISAYEREILLTDYKRDQIFVLDEDLKLVSVIGQKGQGPGEFLGASHLFYNGKYIFVENEMKRAFEIFTKEGEYKGNIFYRRKAPSTRFFENEGAVYYSPKSDEFAICKLDVKSKKMECFGEIESYRTKRETRVKNGRHLLKWKNTIVGVRETNPVIELYDFNGKLLLHKDFDDLESVANFIRYDNSKPIQENSYYVYNSDACIVGNNLYVLILTVGEKAGKMRPMSNTVLCFQLSDTAIRYKETLCLGTGWYNNLCVVGNNLLAFDADKSQLKKFSLK